MGSFRRSSVFCSVIQGLAVWSVAVAGWSVKIPERMSALVGSCVIVPCSFTRPTANVAVEVIWYQYASRGYPLVYSESKPWNVIDMFRDSTELIGSASEGNCSLEIKQTQAAHNAQKIYVWIEPNQLQSGYFYDHTVTLEVTANAPQPEIRLLGNNLREGDEVTLSCDVIHTCPPSPPSVSFRNHKGAPSWSHEEKEAGRWCVSLMTTWELDSADNGRSVVCDVTHTGGKTASREIMLHVTYPPKSVSVHGSRNTVRPGENVSLSCRSEANPPATSFQWYRVVQGRPELMGGSSETIRVTELGRDQNLFRCEARNSVGSGSSPDFEVIKEYPPKSVSVHRSRNTVQPGENVDLSCRSEANPPATSFQWYRVVQGRPELMRGISETIRVTDLGRDQNLFRCEARNSVGSGSSPDFEVIKEYAPLILQDSSCTLGNGLLSCECIVDSSPPANVTWSSVGLTTNEKLNTSSTLSGRVLRSVLTRPMGNEGHRLYCNATNEHGDAFYLLPITVEHFGKWGIVFGAVGGAVLLCLLLGGFLYCKRTKSSQPSPLLQPKPVCDRHPKHVDLSLKEVKLVKDIRARPPANALPETELEPRYEEMKKQPSYNDDVDQTYIRPLYNDDVDQTYIGPSYDDDVYQNYVKPSQNDDVYRNC